MCTPSALRKPMEGRMCTVDNGFAMRHVCQGGLLCMLWMKLALLGSIWPVPEALTRRAALAVRVDPRALQQQLQRIQGHHRQARRRYELLLNCCLRRWPCSNACLRNLLLWIPLTHMLLPLGILCSEIAGAQADHGWLTEISGFSYTRWASCASARQPTAHALAAIPSNL